MNSKLRFVSLIKLERLIIECNISYQIISWINSLGQGKYKVNKDNSETSLLGYHTLYL